MVWRLNGHVLRASRNFLYGLFALSALLFVFMAYGAYNYSSVLMSPQGYVNSGLAPFLLNAFVVGLLVTLAVMAILLYVILHNSEREY